MSTFPDTLTLTSGDAVLQITGGALLSVSSLRTGGLEWLVDPEDLPAGYRVHGQRAGITLLHPWANRLSRDSYRFEGVEARLGPSESRLTRDDNGLAIHGLFAPTPWQLDRTGPGSGVARLTWSEDPAFPFPHEITVRLDLVGTETGAALTIDTEISARGERPVPVAVGWHPYFSCHRGTGAELLLPAMDWLSADARGLPDGTTRARGAERIRLEDQGYDDGTAGLSAGDLMTLRTRGRQVTVSFDSGYPDGQVFAPPDAAIVSLEPMTAPTNALVDGGPLTVARPGAPVGARLRILVDGPDPTA